MAFPRPRLGAVLLLLSARILPGLDMSLEAYEAGNRPVVICSLEDFDGAELIRRMDKGGTVRLTWQFRMGGSDVSVIRLAHRDILGDGYLVFEENLALTGPPLERTAALEEISTLSDLRLPSLGIWRPGDMLEGRVFLDTDMDIPPLSVASLFGGRRERSIWYGVNRPEAGD